MSLVIKNRQLYSIYFSKEQFNDLLNLLLITEYEKEHSYVFMKDFNNSMYNQTKHNDRKHLCMYFLVF